MKKVLGTIAVTVLVGALGTNSAQAMTKAEFQSAKAAYKTAVTQAHATIDTARATFVAAKAAAKTPAERQAARQAFDKAKAAAKASIPTKPVKPDSFTK